MHVGELHEALCHLKARNSDNVLADQLACLESRELAHTVSCSYFAGILANALEFEKLSTDRARLRSVLEGARCKSACEEKGNADRGLARVTASFITEARYHQLEEQRLRPTEKQLQECVAKREAIQAALSETEEWRLWRLDQKEFRDHFGYDPPGDFATHLQAEYESYGERWTRITLVGAMVLMAIEKIGLRRLQSCEADLLTELVKAVVSQNRYKQPAWSDEADAAGALAKMRGYRERAIEYEIRYTPREVGDWEEIETTEDGRVRLYDHTDERIDVVAKGTPESDGFSQD
jgi:hypothetical protein